MGCNYGISDVRIFIHYLLRQKCYCCFYNQNNQINTNNISFNRKSLNSQELTNRQKEISTGNFITFENKFNEKITLRSDTSSIEPVYKESDFNVKH